jgi:hypothetical protein
MRIAINSPTYDDLGMRRTVGYPVLYDHRQANAARDLAYSGSAVRPDWIA